MAWTTPRTWVDSEVPTAAMMNAQIRDNFLHLKTSFVDDGRVAALTSSYLASLDGTNLTGLMKLASDNSITAGKQNFNAGTGTRFVVPVGADKYAGSAGAKTPGSIWVEGDYLHHVDQTGQEWRYLGNDWGYLGASYTPGNCFSYPGGGIAYIDESKHARLCGTTQWIANTAAAVAGSIWMEGSYWHWINTPGTGDEYAIHADINHVDHNDTQSHTDHDDEGPPDHDDHTDEGVGHGDHGDGHGDHWDTYPPHIDWDGHWDHDDHNDYDDHDDSHLDYDDHVDHTDHDNIAEDKRPVMVT